MKKMKYRVIDVKKLDWMKIGEQVQGGEVVLSLDVAKSDFVGLLRTRDGEMSQLIKWSHPQTPKRAWVCRVCALNASTFKV